MKKLAIVGASNAFTHYGYGKRLKNLLKDDCDIFALGGATSIFGVYTLLNENIINEYEHVLFNFNIIETSLLHYGSLKPEIIISHLLFIISQFRNSSSTPIFVLLPKKDIPLYNSCTWIYNAICQIFHIKCLNFEKYFSYIDHASYAQDYIHPFPKFQNFIEQKILKALAEDKYSLNTVEIPEINYKISTPKIVNNQNVWLEKGTSHLRAPVLEFKENDNVEIPATDYITGIVYWIEGGGIYLSVKNSYIHLVSQLDVKNSANMFFCIDLGQSCIQGLQGGKISPAWSTADAYLEASWPMSGNTGQTRIMDGRIFIKNFIVSNKPSFLHGREFYLSHEAVFKSCKNELFFDFSSIAHITDYFNRDPLISKIENGATIFLHILNDRPDVQPLFDSSAHPAISIFFWLWLYGINKENNYQEYYKPIREALCKLYGTPCDYSDIGGDILPAYNKLLHYIYLYRKDLQRHFDVSTQSGQEKMLAWFNQYGIKEFHLNGIIPEPVTE